MPHKWEYRVCSFYIGGTDSDQHRSRDLKELGDDGWELTAVVNETSSSYHTAYLKRPR